jgi:hypothetical protein
MLIKELIRVDEDAEFRNDVQLSNYDESDTNLALLKSYLFSADAPENRTSSIDLLNVVVQGFLSERIENRYVSIANYGHGKSHLALAMMNYFAKPVNSEEVRILLDKIGNAVDSPAKSQRFTEFKRSRGEFLVLRLRGDVPGSLREQFMRGLANSLASHDKTKNVQMPFWYQAAEKFLTGLPEENRKKANNFLEQHEIDLPLLLQNVRNKKDNVYDLCIDLFTYLYGVPPNFGGETSMKMVLDWVVNKFCGGDKAFSGVLILFDEFSLYIQRYASSNAVGDLQDLLNGVSDHQGGVVFLAFAQHDPITTAQNYLHTGQVLESLEHELTRLPRKYYLHSTLESVVDAYLDQSRENWKRLMQTSIVRGTIAGATDRAYEFFNHRYRNILHWGIDRFQEIVTRGCFPLHPITTALLCNLDFHNIAIGAGNPRTLLGFVFEHLNDKKDEQVVTDYRLGWIYPIELVDYFKDRLSGDRFATYENSRRQLGSEAPSEHHDVLKALFLQELAEISARSHDQMDLLSDMTSLSIDQIASILRLLQDQNLIYYSRAQRKYSFWTAIVDPQKLERTINKYLQNQRFDWPMMVSLGRQFFKKLVPVEVNWGHSEDWAAEQYLIARDFLQKDVIRDIAKEYQANSREILQGNRGCLIWLLARNEDELDELRHKAVRVLDDVFDQDSSFPIVLILPTQPNPELLDMLRRMKALDSFSQSDRVEVGQEMYQAEIGKVREAIQNARERFVGNDRVYLSVPRSAKLFVVPRSYRSSIRALGNGSAQRILTECYRLAYPYAPPAFFTQYRALTGTGLRNAIKLLSGILLHNAVGTNQLAIQNSGVARDLCEKFLIQKWGLLGADGRIQPPTNMRVRRAWDFIEQIFQPGKDETQVKNAILPLFSPPYGYDFNTVTLLFCAWIGFNASDLKLYTRGEIVSIKAIDDLVSGGSKDFINSICVEESLSISRHDWSELVDEVHALIDQFNTGSFAQAAAREAIIKLSKFGNEQRGNPTLWATAGQAAENLESALHTALEYDEKASTIIQKIEAGNAVSDLIGLFNKISKLPQAGSVEFSSPPPSELQKRLQDALTEKVKLASESFENIERLTQYGLNRDKLLNLKEELAGSGQIDLIPRVDQALVTLEENADKIRQQELLEMEDQADQARIKNINTSADLKTLYVYSEELKAIEAKTPATERLRKERLQAIEGQIQQLEQFAVTIADAVNHAKNEQTLENLHEKLLYEKKRYESSGYQDKMDEIDKRVRTLKSFFSNLEEKAIKNPASPKEVIQTVRSLRELETQYGNFLSDEHRHILLNEQRRLREFSEERKQEALKWLEDSERQFDSGEDPLKLLERMKQPPVFLPKDKYRRVESLRKVLQEQLDQDTIARIESEFRSIQEKQRQVECIERLERILHEEEVREKISSEP